MLVISNHTDLVDARKLEERDHIVKVGDLTSFINDKGGDGVHLSEDMKTRVGEHRQGAENDWDPLDPRASSFVLIGADDVLVDRCVEMVMPVYYQT